MALMLALFGCSLNLCGKYVPEEAGVSVREPVGGGAQARLADTAADICEEGEAEPTLDIADPGEEVELRYGRGCGGENLELDLVLTGFDPEPTAVWTVAIEGGETYTGDLTVDEDCVDGVISGTLAIDLPFAADGRIVTVTVSGTTSDGRVAEDEVSFLASVVDER